jgi:hypothetical protein
LASPGLRRADARNRASVRSRFRLPPRARLLPGLVVVKNRVRGLRSSRSKHSLPPARFQTDAYRVTRSRPGAAKTSASLCISTGSCVGAERGPCGARRSAAARKCGGASHSAAVCGQQLVARIALLPLIVRGPWTNQDRRASESVPSRRRISGVRNPALDLRQRNCRQPMALRKYRPLTASV